MTENLRLIPKDTIKIQCVPPTTEPYPSAGANLALMTVPTKGVENAPQTEFRMVGCGMRPGTCGEARDGLHGEKLCGSRYIKIPKIQTIIMAVCGHDTQMPTQQSPKMKP